MAFTSTVTATSGSRTGCTQVGSNEILVYGTWSAASVTSGEIDLSSYGSLILRAGINTLTGTQATKWGMNVATDMATASNGSLSIGACTANDTGQYWAILQR